MAVQSVHARAIEPFTMPGIRNVVELGDVDLEIVTPQMFVSPSTEVGAGHAPAAIGPASRQCMARDSRLGSKATRPGRIC